MLRVVAVIILATLIMTGCTQMSSLVDTLNERNVTSCIRWRGFVGGPLTGNQFSIEGTTATGGAELATCMGQ